MDPSIVQEDSNSQPRDDPKTLCVHVSLDHDHGQIESNPISVAFYDAQGHTGYICTYSIKARGVYPGVGEFKNCL